MSNYDAGVLVKNKDISDYFEECLKLNIDAKSAANWITTSIMGYLNDKNSCPTKKSKRLVLPLL